MAYGFYSVSLNVCSLHYIVYGYPFQWIFSIAFHYITVIWGELRGVSNHWHLDSWINSLSGQNQEGNEHRKYQNSALLALWLGKSRVIGGLPSPRTSNAERVSKTWHHNEIKANDWSVVTSVSLYCYWVCFIGRHEPEEFIHWKT